MDGESSRPFLGTTGHQPKRLCLRLGEALAALLAIQRFRLEGLAASAEDQHLFRQFGATLCNGRLEVQQRFGERTRSCVGMRASGHSHQ